MTIRTILAGGVLALLALPAAAATMTVQVTGSVAGVQDLNDAVFGGAVAGGSAFTMTYTYDLAVGTVGTTPNPNGAPQQFFYSGSGYGTPTAATATFASGAFSTTVSGDSAGTATLIDSDDASVAQDLASYRLEDSDTVGGIDTIGWAYFDVYDSLLGLPDDFDTSYSIVSDPATNQMFGSLFLFSYDSATQTTLTYGYLDLTGSQVTVTVTPDVSPVPLPASGALLLAAAAGLGLARRRGRA